MSDASPIPNKKVVTRFAPSPTGFMHVGGVRTAIYAWAYARKFGKDGTFILRIEDTDKKREIEGSIQQIIDSLKWCGLDWDEGPDVGGPHGPYLQSERLDTYKKYATMLYEKGLAYADPYNAEELDAFRKQAETEKRPFLYRNHRPENPPAWDGTRPLRLKITDVKVSKWHDLVRGDLEAGPEALEDIVLIKSDGYPTYNFAHIIDDLLMNVTHIFRADEFISSVPNFLAIYDALGLQHPEFATLPPILGSDGKKKLGKRDGAKDILGYRDDGILPDAMVNFLAFIGWNPGDEREIMTPQEIIEAFSIERIHSSGGKFNEEKLLWTNKEHMKRLADNVFVSEISKYISAPAEMVSKLVPVIRERISSFGELKKMKDEGELDMYVEAPTYDPALLLCAEKQRKGRDIDVKGLAPILGKVKELIQTAGDQSFVSADAIKEVIWPYADEEGRGIVLWATRVSLSGKERSPDPFTLMYILGKDEAVKRLENAISRI